MVPKPIFQGNVKIKMNGHGLTYNPTKVDFKLNFQTDLAEIQENRIPVKLSLAGNLLNFPEEFQREASAIVYQLAHGSFRIHLYPKNNDEPTNHTLVFFETPICRQFEKYPNVKEHLLVNGSSAYREGFFYIHRKL